MNKLLLLLPALMLMGCAAHTERSVTPVDDNNPPECVVVSSKTYDHDFDFSARDKRHDLYCKEEK